MNRKLKFFRKVISSNFRRLPFPHKISFILTYQCNLRCKMCNIWQKAPQEELGLEEIQRFFKASNRFSWIGITGGEPFLREDIGDILKIILDHCRELSAIHFATNGTMSEKIIAVVQDTLSYAKGKTELLFTLSVDGPPSLHDSIRGREGTWNKCMATFRRLKQLKSVRPRLGITLAHHNLNAFPALFSSLKDAEPSLRFDDITVNMFQRSPFYYGNDSMEALDPAAAVEAIHAILAMDKDRFTINNFLRRKYLNLYKRYVKNKKCPLKCQALSSTCVLDPYGNIYPCGIYGQRIANINECDYDLGTLWAAPRTREISEQCSRSRCPSCWSPCDAYSAIGSSLFSPELWRNQ